MNDQILRVLHGVAGGGMTAEAVASRLGGVYPVAKVAGALTALATAGTVGEVPEEPGTYRVSVPELDATAESAPTPELGATGNENDQQTPELGVPPDEGAPKSHRSRRL